MGTDRSLPVSRTYQKMAVRIAVSLIGTDMQRVMTDRRMYDDVMKLSENIYKHIKPDGLQQTDV